MLQRGIGAGTIGVQDVVGGFELDGFCEFLTCLSLAGCICLARLVDEHGLCELLLSKQLVAFLLEGFGHYGGIID